MNKNETPTSEFSWQQFWVSFAYENLPPVLLSPLAALLIEGSINRAWNVCQNRNLLAVSLRYNPWLVVLFSWLIVYPGSWVVTLGMITVLVADTAVLGGIDPLQMFCAYAFLFCRRLIIAVKYGYFNAAEYAALSAPAPEWTFDKTAEKLIARGWSNPKGYPGLVEAELQEANRLTGDELSQVRIGTPSHDTESLRDVVMGILDRAYDLQVPRWHEPLVFLAVISILGALLSAKHASGAPIFGYNVEMILVNLGTYTAILSGMGIMGFGLLCAFDFARRRLANVILDGMLTNGQGDSVDGYTFERSSAADLKAWMVARKVIRAFGERYYLRVQSYTSILLCFSILCVAFLNFLAWTQTTHHISTIITLSATIVVIAFIGSFAMYRAIQLQQQSYAARASLLDSVLELEVEEALNRQTAEKTASTKNILRQLDENLNFAEIIHKPTSVLGYRADNGVIGSVLGVLITGVLLAVQGFVDTGLSYSAAGWSFY